MRRPAFVLGLGFFLAVPALVSTQDSRAAGDIRPGTVIGADAIEAARQQSVKEGTVDRLVQGLEIPGGKTALAMLYRTKPETNGLIHERVTEIYQIIEGSGLLVTGGRLADGWRATDLARVWAGPSRSGVHEGGESRRVGPKDVIVVPAGTPHRFSALDGPITYLVYRFEAAN
jgi:mannose-6-phosphate isomerase-like protein (cupin superfamily)